MDDEQTTLTNCLKKIEQIDTSNKVNFSKVTNSIREYTSLPVSVVGDFLGTSKLASKTTFQSIEQKEFNELIDHLFPTRPKDGEAITKLKQEIRSGLKDIYELVKENHAPTKENEPHDAGATRVDTMETPDATVRLDKTIPNTPKPPRQSEVKNDSELRLELNPEHLKRLQQLQGISDKSQDEQLEEAVEEKLKKLLEKRTRQQNQNHNTNTSHLH